jgi:hypothetical protein
MKIKGLNLDEFFDHVGRVRKELKKRKNRERLLIEALTDVPALATLFEWIYKTATSKMRHSPKNKTLLAQMERDFFVLLALWHMEKEQEGQKPDLKVVGDEGRRSGRMN